MSNLSPEYFQISLIVLHRLSLIIYLSSTLSIEQLHTYILTHPLEQSVKKVFNHTLTSQTLPFVKLANLKNNFLSLSQPCT